MLMFSVIVPIYNVDKYLNKCVDSVLNQTYKSFELILVDDGSPDNCPAICDEYAQKDSRIKVIHKENGGLVSARKAGAEVAKGEYVICVDGDDWLHTQCLECYSKIIAEKPVDIIVSNSENAFEDETQNRRDNLPYRNGLYQRENIENEIFPLLIQNEYAKYFAPSVWAKAYRSDLYKKMQLAVSNQIKIGEDGACTIPCVYNATSLYITDAVTYYYRQNLSSMTKEKKAFNLNGPKLIHNHLQNQIKIREFDFEQQLYRKTAHELFTVVVTQFYRKESCRTIIKDIKETLAVPDYAESIKKSKFKSLNGRLAIFALRHRAWLLIKLYSMIHSF